MTFTFQVPHPTYSQCPFCGALVVGIKDEHVMVFKCCGKQLRLPLTPEGVLEIVIGKVLSE